MKKILIALLCFCPFLSFGQMGASFEEIHKIAQAFSQRYLNQNEADITFVSYPTFSMPLYEVSVNDYSLIISSEKFTPPVLMVVQNDRHSPVLNNPNLPTIFHKKILLANKICGR